MDYSNYTREQLIELIDELQMLNKELLNEKIQANKLEFSWSGKPWSVWNFPNRFM